MININVSDLPLKVILVDGSRAIIMGITPDSKAWIGCYENSSDSQWSASEWFCSTLTSTHTVSWNICKIGWLPTIDWGLLPAQVKYVTKNGGTNHVYMWENRPMFNSKRGSWELEYFSPSFSGTMPAKWVGLEDWKGGPEAILERPVC